jgi:uncharacterized protein
MPARLRSAAVFSALLVWAGLFVAAQDIKIPRSPDRWVTDEAGFLSPGTVASLDSRLEAYEQETGHQVLVYIGRTTGGVSIEEWAVRAFEAWKVGRKGLDDGLVLFIMAEDHTIRIEVGYGLEDRVPDARAFRVINEILLPGIRSGQRDAAVSEAVGSLLSLISGRDDGAGGPPETQARRPHGRSALGTLLVAAAFIFFFILLITNPSLALWLLFSIFSGGRGGGRGGWGGGGGFSGGGGRSGGGGASGSW